VNITFAPHSQDGRKAICPNGQASTAQRLLVPEANLQIETVLCAEIFSAGIYRCRRAAGGAKHKNQAEKHKGTIDPDHRPRPPQPIASQMFML
jgi:hypothetical protein